MGKTLLQVLRLFRSEAVPPVDDAINLLVSSPDNLSIITNMIINPVVDEVSNYGEYEIKSRKITEVYYKDNDSRKVFVGLAIIIPDEVHHTADDIARNIIETIETRKLAALIDDVTVNSAQYKYIDNVWESQ